MIDNGPTWGVASSNHSYMSLFSGINKISCSPHFRLKKRGEDGRQGLLFLQNSLKMFILEYKFNKNPIGF